jgi:hypothetical protein
VVIGDQVAIAQSFNGLRVVANALPVRPDLGLRKNDSREHLSIPLTLTMYQTTCHAAFDGIMVLEHITSPFQMHKKVTGQLF